MSTELIDGLFILYMMGLMFFGYQSYQVFSNLQEMYKNRSVSIFKLRPDLLRYLMLKPAFWPYFFITEKSPIERFSELFFKHYGDEGHTYLGSRGLKNFLNDVLRGVNRYKNYRVHYLCWPVPQESALYNDSVRILGENQPFYAHIIYGHHHNNYLLDIKLSNEHLSSQNEHSRFVLDQCERLSESEFKAKLQQVNYQKARELL